MKEFIQELIHGYVNNNLTWHDIQDMLEAKIMEQDRHGLTTDKAIINERNELENYWLNLIEESEKAFTRLSQLYPSEYILAFDPLIAEGNFPHPDMLRTELHTDEQEDYWSNLIDNILKGGE